MIWQRPIDVALDRDGPVSAPFDFPAADFVERPIFELFEDLAHAIPDAAALGDGSAMLTYAEVLGEARRLASAVSARVAPGRAVAVLLPNAPSSVIGVLACLAARRCCIVLNADHPKERNAAILRDAAAAAVIVLNRDAVDKSVVSTGTALIQFDDAPAVESAPGSTNVDPDAPAIVLYTSGSEGQPKGIVLSQATILARVRNNIVAMHLGRADRFLSLGALGTTAGLVASVMALLAGSLQLVVSASAAGASGLLDLIRDERVTIVWGVPALLRLLFDDKSATPALRQIRVIRTFGERLLDADCAAWRKVLPDSCHFAITYGQTEATIAQWFVPRNFTADTAVLPTGYVLSEHEYAVLGDDGSPAAEGDVGELVVRSRFVALGEWKDGEVVPGRVACDPVDTRRRILRTGDLVRIAPPGLLQVVGRVDRQVKVNGQRVEPAEIEDALRTVPGVADAAIAVKRTGEETRLIAFVVPRDVGDADLLNRARAATRRSLPSHMRPARVLAIEALPLLPGGKVDHQALVTMEIATPKESSIPGAAAGGRRGWLQRARKKAATEQASAVATRSVAIAWRRVLRTPAVPGETFLDAAGDSLRLLEFVFALESHTGRQLPLEAFSVEATAEQMALALDGALRRRDLPRPGARVFLLPGARGDTPGLAGLRADCLPRVAMRLITYPDWREMSRAGLALEAIVEAAASQVRAMAPPGPICLVGYSFGVPIAYLASRLLEGEGRDVAQVVLLDMAPAADRAGNSHLQPSASVARAAAPEAARLSALARRAWWSTTGWVAAARDGTVAERLGMFLAPLGTSLLRRSGMLAFGASSPAKFGSRWFGELRYWTSHHMSQEFRLRALSEWARRWTKPANRLRAPLLLVRTDAYRGDAPEDLGWSELAERVRVVRVGGGHVSMLSAAHRNAVSSAVAAALATALANAGVAEAVPN